MSYALKNSIAAMAAVIIGAVAGYFLFFSSGDWRAGTSDMHRGYEDRMHPWVGASHPRVTIYEFFDYDCPHCIETHKKLRRIVASKPDAVRLVRYDYGRMHCLVDDDLENASTCEMVRAAICAGQQMDYWKWNDMIVEAPRHTSTVPYHRYVEEMANQANLDIDAFKSCMVSPHAFASAQSVYLRARKARVHGTPSYLVNGELLTFAEVERMLTSL